MSISEPLNRSVSFLGSLMSWGTFWLLVTCISAGVYFYDGLDALVRAWSTPEYSHGPLIPVLSAFMFLRELREFPPEPGPKTDRWVGVVVIVVSLMIATLGKLSNISDLVAYATILWVGGMLLISFGWKTGKNFWPSVLHLVYMLPLPGVIYFKVTTSLQLVSSEVGVWLLRLLDIPVFLDGNIIDLGMTKLHVAEACSGLRYMFPIMSFSYVFAVLYRGPVWHKAVLLLSAVPIAIFMNSVRIAIAGIIIQYYGVEWLEGFTHFFEGWVVFIACILVLFGLARLMLMLHPQKLSVGEALDLETEGLAQQFSRLSLVQPSRAMITAAILMIAVCFAWMARPAIDQTGVQRDSFALFPRSFGPWVQNGPPEILSSSVRRSLGADDYHSVNYVDAETGETVSFFSAWYEDQSRGGVHSPEICLPGAGWEIAWLERTNVSEQLNWNGDFMINRVIIQQGEARLMVFYWFEQKGRKVAWDFAAKFYLMMDGARTGRTDGGLVRLTTVIGDEDDSVAEQRLFDFMEEMIPAMPRFIPTN